MGILSAVQASSLSSLKQTNDLIGLSQKRLAAGKSVFSAADDSTKFRLSEGMLQRSRALDQVNDGINLALKALDLATNALGKMTTTVENMQKIARQAQTEIAAGSKFFSTNATVTAATNFAATPITETVPRTITINAGEAKRFTYTIPTTGDLSVGAFVNALNNADIGVKAEFNPAGGITYRSTNGKDITFEGSSNRTAITTILPGTTFNGAAINAPASFANNGLAPTATETGLTFSFGGTLRLAVNGVTTADTFTSGGSISLKDASGNTRTITVAGGGTVQSLLDSTNALTSSTGIVAEIVSSGANKQLQFRNINGGDITVTGATGDFASSTGAASRTGAGVLKYAIPDGGTTVTAPPLSLNTATRTEFVNKMTKYRADIDRYATEAGLPGGRNLLSNQVLTVVLSEGTGVAQDTLAINGNAITSTSLGITAAFTFATDAAINTDLNNLQTAMNRLRDEQTRLGSNQNYIKTRYDLNKQDSSLLKTSGEAFVAVDQEEESAMLTALNTRASFAVQSYSLANQATQGLLQLLR